MIELYYTIPEEKMFDELKKAAILIWEQYDNTYGYVTEKVNCIKDLPNEEGNFMYIVCMFDIENQRKLAELLDYETRLEIRKRLIDGGMTEERFIVF
jgi:hypothetical protein